MRAVIDTNVLVSALLTPGGVPALLIAAIRNYTLIPVVSESILAEYAEVLHRPKFRLENNRGASLLEDMKGLALFMKPQPVAFQNFPDPDDAPFITAALTAGSAIITGKAKHFPQGIGVEILSPVEALSRLQAQ